MQKIDEKAPSGRVRSSNDSAAQAPRRPPCEQLKVYVNVLHMTKI